MVKLLFKKEGTTKVPSTNSGLTPTNHAPQQDRRARVAARAFELYQRRGRTHGHDLQDWFQAEEELNGSSAS